MPVLTTAKFMRDSYLLGHNAMSMGEWHSMV
jgi:hypothetical protein